MIHVAVVDIDSLPSCAARGRTSPLWRVLEQLFAKRGRCFLFLELMLSPLVTEQLRSLPMIPSIQNLVIGNWVFAQKQKATAEIHTYFLGLGVSSSSGLIVGHVHIRSIGLIEGLVDLVRRSVHTQAIIDVWNTHIQLDSRSKLCKRRQLFAQRWNPVGCSWLH